MYKTEVLVIGAGPAGLGAAITAAQYGADVLLIDENKKAGGQLYKQIHKFFGSGNHYAGTRGFQIADILLNQGNDLGVKTFLNTRALGILDNGNVAVLHNEIVEEVCADRIILATGAKENALPFPGWTLPGVMTAGAAQTFSNVHGTAVGEKVLMIGSGNVGLIVSYQLMQAGVEIVALVEAQDHVTGYQVHAGKIRRAGVPIYVSHTVLEAHGTERVKEAVIGRIDENFKVISGTEKTVPVDTILIAVGLNPRTELASMMHCKMAYEKTLGGLLPIHDTFMRSTNPRIYVCGDLAGVEEANTALDEGRLAGLSALASLRLENAEIIKKQEELRESLEALRSGVNASARKASKERIVQKGGFAYEERS